MARVAVEKRWPLLPSALAGGGRGLTGAGAVHGFPPKTVPEESGGPLTARIGSPCARPVEEAGAALRPAPVGMVGRERLAIAPPSRRRAGLTLVELLLVGAILAVLAAFLLVTLGPARKMARVAQCTSHLRQIGMAYRMYWQDYNQYPHPGDVAGGELVKEPRLLFCPEDTTLAPLGTASSYRFRATVPPHFTPLVEATELDPNVVLAGCQHHLGQREVVVNGDNTMLTPPTYPFHLVLRAEGRAERVHMNRIRHQLMMSEGQTVRQTLYPGEPGYEAARAVAVTRR